MEKYVEALETFGFETLFFFALVFWGNLGYMIDNMKMKAGQAITLLNFMEKFAAMENDMKYS